MKPLSPTESAPLRFTQTEGKHRIRAQSGRIAWLHTLSEKPGVKFDLAIRDGLGRLKFERKDFGGETVRNGELLNIPTMIGEELEIEASNIRGDESIDLFLN